MNETLTLNHITSPLAKNETRRCIHELFSVQARRNPQSVAVGCGQEKLTYRELHERANRLARYLQRLRVGPDALVALYLERSLDLVIAILGVLKAGAAYVPMDPAAPQERLSFILSDTQAPVLLTQERLRDKLPPCSATVISLDGEQEAIKAESSVEPANPATSDNVAYVIYTSGSTGTPKGVLVTHHNVVRLFGEAEQWYGFNSSDVWTLFHSYTFDFSVWELWGALLYGARLVVVPYLTSRSPGDFYGLLGREGVTVLNQTPSAFRQLIRAEETAANRQPLALRYVIFGGEALELQSLKPWFDRHGDERPLLVNMYGITETTVHVTYRPIRRVDLVNGLGSVIGVPIPDLQIHLLDEDLKPVPVGAPGEIFVGGGGVARGYLNRPELTRERFLPDPFSTTPGARLYRSGDLAQYTSKGDLEYLGRLDQQVKIRGFRVELGEIESALNRHPSVRESVVVAHGGVNEEKRLVAYAVTTDPAPTVTELRNHLGKIIPDYMIPALFLFLKELPLTVNGKVDRRALPSPDRARPELKTEFLPPRTPAERTLAEIWSEVLEIEPIGVHDNFFELGGDSIRSIGMLSRAQQRGLNLALHQVFEHPTVAGLAACAETGGTKATFAPTEPFSLITEKDRTQLPPEVEDAYPITQLQMGMFYANDLDPLSAVYHDIFSYRIQAVFDLPKLEQAVARLIQRHPMLRTSFHIEGFSEPLQLVHRQARASFTVEDCRGLSKPEQKRILGEWISAEKRRPFNRTVAPLIRFHTQVQAEDCFQFIVSFHHVYLDGWSLAAVLTEIFQDYKALTEGAESAIVPPQLVYREFVALERRDIASPECRRFWTGKLAGISAQRLPRWPKEMCAGGHEQVRGPEVQFEPRVLEGLQRVVQRLGVPLKTVLLAVHQRVMSLLYGQADVVSGLISNGRPEEIDGERLIGLFLNTVPIRMRLEGGTWVDLIRQTFEAQREVIPHRRFPLPEIQRLNGGQAFFETAFDFVHFHVYKNLQGCQGLDFAEGDYFEANNLTSLTTFAMDATSSRLEMHMDYDPNALCRTQIEQISQYYVATLEAMLADPEGRYEVLSPLSEAERSRILVEWNDTEAEYPRAVCLHELVQAQATRTPDRVAVRFEGQQLTYRELDARANQLAHFLQRRGVAADQLVGLCLDRSLEMVIGLLGILKAGGAYVPLDPGYPPDRLAFLLEDAGVEVLLSQGGLAQRLPPHRAQTVCLDADWSCIAGESTSPAPARAKADNLAYMIYTSGSTGQPKGALNAHTGIVNRLLWMQDQYRLGASDTVLQKTPFSFDVSVWEFFWPLLAGARLVLARPGGHQDPAYLAEIIAREQVTVAHFVPSMLRAFLGAGVGLENCRALREVICSGEALAPDLVQAFHAKLGANLHNLYGPTEAAVDVTYWPCPREQELPTVPIGRPVANTQCYILDAGLQPVPVGTAGELHLGGIQVGRGYHRRPELTAQKFIPNPFRDGSGGRLYKTGDLCRYLPDGNIEYLGRLDHQVKIRGFRIELGEIESALSKHPAVTEAAVVVREAGLGDKRLAAYLVIREGSLPAATALREFLQASLPDYMVPASFVAVEALPKTPNGKLDRRALLEAGGTALRAEHAYRPPRSPNEQRLAAIWQEVLRVPKIGVEDNFFEIGGDSLLATTVFARMNKVFASEIALREVFERPTIRALAECLNERNGAPSPKQRILPRRHRAQARP